MTTSPKHLSDPVLLGDALVGGDHAGTQEVRAWLGHDPRSRWPPAGVCTVVAAVAARAHDHSEEARSALAQVLPRFLGSRGSAALDQQRCGAVAIDVIRGSICSRLATIAARPGLAEGRRAQILGWRRRLAAIPDVVDRVGWEEVVDRIKAIAADADADADDDDADPLDVDELADDDDGVDWLDAAIARDADAARDAHDAVAMAHAYAVDPAYALCYLEDYADAVADAYADADAHAYIELIERLLAMTDGAPAPDDPAMPIPAASARPHEGWAEAA